MLSAKIISSKLVLLLMTLLPAFLSWSQTVLNGSINGGPVGNSQFVTVNDWSVCLSPPGIMNSPDLCDVSFPSWSSVSSVTPVASPDGGTWFGIANGTNPTEEECVGGYMTGLVPGNAYNLHFYGACFGTGAGNYADGNICNVEVTINGIVNTVSIPKAASVWNPYCIAFEASSVNMTFRVQIISGGGYASLDGFTVEALAAGAQSGVLDLGPDLTLCTGQSVLLDATVPGATYEWQDNSTDSVYLASTAGTYWVTATQACGTQYDTINIYVDSCNTPVIIPGEPAIIDMPNVFSPNGDQINDLYSPVTISGVQELSATIVNRWGNIVYETDDILINWNGENNSGAESPDGVYFYVINYVDGKGDEGELHGFFHLVRN